MHLPQWCGRRFEKLGHACDASCPMGWSLLLEIGVGLQCICPNGVVVAMKVGTDLQCICPNGVVITRKIELAYNDWPESQLRRRIFAWCSTSCPFLSSGATTTSVF